MASVSHNTSLLIRIISSSVIVANRAGKIIKDIMSKGDLGIVKKGWNDWQTEADRSAQRCIVASLSRHFPKIEIIGEESLDESEGTKDDLLVSEFDQDVLKIRCPEELSSVKEEDVVIWVDPLDGTSEYTQGLLDHVTVLIGVAVQGKAVAGIIHQPYFNYKGGEDNTEVGRTIWGLVGVGAFGFQNSKPPVNQRIITTTRSHSNSVVQAALDCLEPTEIIRVGGAGHKVLLLLEGKAHAYVFASAGCKKWDTCGPEAVLLSIGGFLTDIHGNQLEYHKNVQHKNAGGVLATYDKAVHSWYLQRIPPQIKEVLPP